MLFEFHLMCLFPCMSCDDQAIFSDNQQSYLFAICSAKSLLMKESSLDSIQNEEFPAQGLSSAFGCFHGTQVPSLLISGCQSISIYLCFCDTGVNDHTCRKCNCKFHQQRSSRGYLQRDWHSAKLLAAFHIELSPEASFMGQRSRHLRLARHVQLRSTSRTRRSLRFPHP